jgi:hypothetical protein
LWCFAPPQFGQGSLLRNALLPAQTVSYSRNDRRKERIENLNIMIKAACRTTNESLRNQAISELKAEAEKDKEYSAMIKSVLAAQGIL